MTVSRRYLPTTVACLLTLGVGSAGFAAGGSALDPYVTISAPTSLKNRTKNEKGKKNHHVPITKKAREAEKIVQQDDSTQSQTYVKLPGGSKSKHYKEKETALAPEPKKARRKEKLKSVPTTTKISDLAPAKENEPKVSAATSRAVNHKTVKTSAAKNGAGKDKTVTSDALTSGKSDDSVMGGIKAIGAGYSQTFKAASHGVAHSTKAASEAVLAGSKKMGSGIASGAKASGDALKKGANIVGQGFKATGEKIKEEAAPLGEKLAKAPAAAAKGVRAAGEKTKEGGEAIGSKLAHLPKPKMPKIGIPFMGNKKAASDKQAKKWEQNAQDEDTNVAAALKQTPIKPARKQTPVVDDPPRIARAPKAPKVKSLDKSNGVGQSLATMSGHVSKTLGKLWPFGHKEPGSDVAGKQTQPPM